MAEQKTETVVVIGQGLWSQGPDLKAARKRWVARGGQLSLGYSIVTLDADTSFEGVNGMGQIAYIGNTPTSRDIPAREGL